MAAGGTLYFDQVQDLVPPLQAKLLRVIEERRFERVGGTAHARGGRAFRGFGERRPRGGGAGGAVPRGPLSPPERGAAAARAAAQPPRGRAAARARRSSRASASAGATAASGFAPEAAEMLKGYLWPGNVRELRSVVERGRPRRARGRGAAIGAAAAARRAALDAVGRARTPAHAQGRRAGLHPLGARRGGRQPDARGGRAGHLAQGAVGEEAPLRDRARGEGRTHGPEEG